jgi:dolichol kinase
MISVVSLAALSVPLLAFVFLNDVLPSWGSRKVLHMGTGSLLALVDPSDPLLQPAVYAVTTLFVALVWVRNLHISEVRDVGIINYLLFCSVCVALHIPFTHVLPLFYADPMGAVVGRTVASPKLVGSKSIAGTLAVFATAALTAAERTWTDALASAATIAAIELFAGKWDNPAIGGFLLYRYYHA